LISSDFGAVLISELHGVLDSSVDVVFRLYFCRRIS
jgi:hypothetical protein